MNLLHFESLDSTNKYIKENYKSLKDFTFVSSSFQTDGKGRMDRCWNSEKDSNLLFSFLVKNKKINSKFNYLSIGTASLVAKFLESTGIKNVSIKWPNDVYVGDKKICGILLEGNLPEYLVIGVGINVNQEIFEGDYRIPPTSVNLELGKKIDLNKFKIKLFHYLYRNLHNPFLKLKVSYYLKKHNYLLGKKVKLNGITGTVTGLTKDLHLLVDNKKYNSGEIEII